MIGKSCPKCVQQVPVACKACPCGYSFFNAKRNIISAAQAAQAASAAQSPPSQTSSEEGPGRRRRTERVKRGKPNYYDALEYDKQTKKRVRRKSGADTQTGNQKKLGIDIKTGQLKKKKKKLDKEQEEKESSPVNFSPDDSIKAYIILAEINRKIGSVNFQP